MAGPRTRIAMMMTADPGRRAAALYRLMAWLSPSFPTGAFSYSHGLEAAAASGSVRDRNTLETWIAAILAQGSGRIDADILCQAHRAALAGDGAGLAAANRRGLAFRGSAELALEAAQQGEAFLKTCLAAWPEPFIVAWAAPHPNPLPASGERESAATRRAGDGREGAALPALSRNAGEGGGARSVTPGEGVCHAAMFGMAAARAGTLLDDALLGYLQAFAANLMSAGLRLGLIGQTDGQRILAALEPAIGRAAAAAMARAPADFGAATFAADLASMAHETQYSRLFRS